MGFISLVSECPSSVLVSCNCIPDYEFQSCSKRGRPNPQLKKESNWLKNGAGELQPKSTSKDLDR